MKPIIPVKLGTGPGGSLCSRGLSRKFRSAENFGPGTEIPRKSFLLYRTEIFEYFGRCVEK